MLIALTLLLAALSLVLIKDREFWFPSAPTAQTWSEPLEEPTPEPRPQSAETHLTIQPKVSTQPKVNVHASRRAAVADRNSAAPSGPVVMSRGELPPLDIEVVAGSEHRTIDANGDAVKVDVSPTFPATPASSSQEFQHRAGATEPSGHNYFSPGDTNILTRSVQPAYPLLAREMKVQGAVVLEVLIGRNGNIQHIRVISGPTILSAAAQEAVKQWRFKPYLQSGQTIQTTAHITVNFTIST